MMADGQRVLRAGKLTVALEAPPVHQFESFVEELLVLGLEPRSNLKRISIFRLRALSSELTCTSRVV